MVLSVLAKKAMAVTQGKGGVLAMEAVTTQGMHRVSANMAVEPRGRYSVLARKAEPKSKGIFLTTTGSGTHKGMQNRAAKAIVLLARREEVRPASSAAAAACKINKMRSRNGRRCVCVCAEGLGGMEFNRQC